MLSRQVKYIHVNKYYPHALYTVNEKNQQKIGGEMNGKRQDLADEKLGQVEKKCL